MAHDVQELAEEAQHGRVKEDPGGTYGDGSTQTMISNHFQSERGGGGWMSIYRLFFCEHQGAIRQSSSLAGDYSQINGWDGKTIWLMDSRRFKSLLISIPICAVNVYITYKQVQVNLECYHHPFPFRNAKKSCPHGGCWSPKKTAHWQQNTLASWLPIWRKCGNPHGITIQLTLEAPKSVKIWLVSNILGFSHFGSIFGIPLGRWHQITVNFGEWRNRNVPGPRARVGHRVWPPFWDPPAAQQWHPCSGCHGAGALGVPSAGQNSRGKGILDHLGSTFHLLSLIHWLVVVVLSCLDRFGCTSDCEMCIYLFDQNQLGFTSN